MDSSDKHRPRQVLLVGGTGRIGGYAAKLLAGRGVPVRAVVRNPDAARGSVPTAVELVQGDLSQPATLPAAVDGADAVLLVVPVSPQQADLEANLVRAVMVANPAALIVKVSGLGTAADSPVDSGRRHAQTESLIRGSGLPFVFLHPQYFMQNLVFQIEPARSQGVIRAAVGDTPIAMIDAADIAAVAARLLAGEVDRNGQTLRLTGPQSLRYTDVAAELSARLGRRVVYKPQTIDELRAQLEQAGQPAWHVRLVCQFNRAFADGMAAEVSDAAAGVLGRSPRTLAAFFDDVFAADSLPAGTNPFPS